MKNLRISAGALLLAAAACVAWHVLGSKPGLDTAQALPASARPAGRVSPGHGGAPSVTHAQDNAGGPQAGHAPQAASHQEVMQKLQDAAVTYDPAQLPVIRPYLVDADPAVRAAAVNAMVVLGDASAAPMLRNAAKLLGLPDEAKTYESKAAYLELPPVSSEELASKMDPSASE